MSKKTTIYDIAKALNITVSTVSRALSGFPAISEATRKAVVEMAEKLNYSPNRLASALKSGKTHIIGVIVPSVQAHFFASIIHCIEDGLKDSGYRVIIYQSNESVENEINGVKTLLEAQVDGIMASLSLETQDVSHFQEIIKQNKPLILFDRVNEELAVPTITLDDFKAGYMATQHLIDQGYRNIAFITTIHQIKIFNDRLKGYKAALQDNHLPVLEEYIHFGGLSIKDGRFGAGKLMRLQNKPDAIVAGDDFTALGVIKKLKEINQMPPDVGVIGFANEAFSAYITPNLSTIDQHASQMGKECAKMFLKMISQENPYHNTEHIVLNPTVVERQSSAKLPS
ncbi:LacI family transcriptional regulator [Pedobacter psychrotolerans]|uniref:LacI family transcriptional regulator n=1 Tax=Pedobacter psychrotolerans TaxID=1843235 RepID=A0A4R2HFH9_9SPHI|nr:LacI family DNA-binding transcriptional regulator [Pedobacter psychrotolerans]TCO26845.1 LacI family transcriptional regulator [Pedobacter psychrotolerans]GGE56933.1 LacI family transcriptional regulator [Pedobacter psychrotolerans]